MTGNFDALVNQGDRDLLYEKFMTYFRETYAPHYQTVWRPVSESGILNYFAKTREILVLLFDDKNYQVLYASDNFEEFTGYTPAELGTHNVRIFFQTLAPEHLAFPFHLITNSYRVLEHFGGKEATFKVHCGLKLLRKDGKPLRILMRQYPIGLDAEGKSEQSVVTMEDVSHLLKGEHFWCRWDMGPLGGRASAHSSDCKLHFQDILSEREIEVLRLIMAGLDSKTIAERLFISTNTVEKHRKNMIARTGARDTTALGHLCKMCQIL